MRTHRLGLHLATLCLAVSATASLALGPQSADEDVARRQLESGRSFARQGNYTEALKDFRAVAETHASSSVAGDALLEIARYYLDIAGNITEATAAVDAILKKYPTSNSAPDAYVMAGRLALARSRQPADIEAALANFDRVPRLFPASDAVPRSLQLAGDALWYAKRFDEALAQLGRVEVEYTTDAAAADAYLTAGRVRVSLGDPITAMESLQQVRNRWPGTPKAAAALDGITQLHRLYVRARSGPAYALSPDTAGPAKLENVVGLAMTARHAVYWASESDLGIVTPANAARPPAPAAKPRGLALDASGNLVVLDGGLLRTETGGVACLMPRSNGTVEALSKLDSAVQVSNGDWLVMDGNEKVVNRFTRAGAYSGPFSTNRLSRLAINAVDEVAGIDRDQKSIAVFNGAGKLVSRVPFKGVGYDLQNVEDLTFDAFGHLYVLDRTAIVVFSPFAAAPADPAAPKAPAPAAAGPGPSYHLLTVFSEPEKAQTGFHKATAFTVDQSGTVYLYDDHAQRIMVYR